MMGFRYVFHLTRSAPAPQFFLPLGNADQLYRGALRRTASVCCRWQYCLMRVGVKSGDWRFGRHAPSVVTGRLYGQLGAGTGATICGTVEPEARLAADASFTPPRGRPLARPPSCCAEPRGKVAWLLRWRRGSPASRRIQYAASTGEIERPSIIPGWHDPSVVRVRRRPHPHPPQTAVTRTGPTVDGNLMRQIRMPAAGAMPREDLPVGAS